MQPATDPARGWPMPSPAWGLGLGLAGGLVLMALRHPGVGMVLIALGLVLYGWLRSRLARRRALVLAQPLPSFLRRKLQAHYPHLNERQLADVERGLKQFFKACLKARGLHVAMPSKAVDALWHEFILYTRGYERFCRQVFGKTLHHTPAEAMPPEAQRQGTRFHGLRRAWRWACLDESLNPLKPARLPLLFALDGLLAIEGGYRYSLDCTKPGAASLASDASFCATDFDRSSSGGCGSGGCGSSDGGDGGGSDGGCGGDGGGCGGGCGGGGD